MGSDRWKKPIRGTDFTKRIFLGLSLFRLIRRCQAEIFHLNLTWPRSYWDLRFARLAGVPVIAHVRSLSPRFRLRPRVLRLASAIICVSEIVRQNVLDWHPHPKVFRVYDPIDPAAYSATVGRTEAKKELGFPFHKRLICSIALLSPHKGHDTAIHSFARIAGELQDVDLCIVGGSPDGSGRSDEGQRLKAIVGSYGIGDRVHFTDAQIPNVRLAFEASDLVYALTKCGEAFGRVAVEAGAATRPVIATNLGATPELVVHGKTGILVPGEDAGAVAHWTRTLLKDKNLGSDIATAARSRVIELYGPQLHAEQVQQVYRKVSASH